MGGPDSEAGFFGILVDFDDFRDGFEILGIYDHLSLLQKVNSRRCKANLLTIRSNEQIHLLNLSSQPKIGQTHLNSIFPLEKVVKMVHFKPRHCGVNDFLPILIHDVDL